MIFNMFFPQIKHKHKTMDLHPCPNCNFPCLGKQCKDCHFRMVFEKNKYANCCIDCRNHIENDIIQKSGKRCRNCQNNYIRNNSIECKNNKCKNLFIGTTTLNGKRFCYCKECFLYLKNNNECFCNECSVVLYFNYEKQKNKCGSCLKKNKINMKTKSLDKKNLFNSKCLACFKKGHVLYCKSCFNNRLFCI